jgi:hypothetical protein
VKHCRNCNETKPLDEFYLDQSRADVRQPRCKACKKAWYQSNKVKQSEYAKAHYQANKDKYTENHKAYVRVHREQIAEYKRSYREDNKDKLDDQIKAWRQANPDKVSAGNNRRRAREACAVPQRWTKSECPETLCYWCGVDLNTVKLHLEHLMPLSLGGEAKPYNEAPSCKDCNLSKHNKHPLVWIAELV